MKAMKKLLAMLLVLSLCLGLFAGCVNEIPDPTNSDQEQNGTGNGPVLGGDETPNTDIYPLNSDKKFTFATKSQDMNERYFAKLWQEVTGVEIDYVVCPWAGRSCRTVPEASCTRRRTRCSWCPGR